MPAPWLASPPASAPSRLTRRSRVNDGVCEAMDARPPDKQDHPSTHPSARSTHSSVFSPALIHPPTPSQSFPAPTSHCPLTVPPATLQPSLHLLTNPSVYPPPTHHPSAIQPLSVHLLTQRRNLQQRAELLIYQPYSHTCYFPQVIVWCLLMGGESCPQCGEDRKKGGNASPTLTLRGSRGVCSSGNGKSLSLLHRRTQNQNQNRDGCFHCTTQRSSWR